MGIYCENVALREMNYGNNKKSRIKAVIMSLRLFPTVDEEMRFPTNRKQYLLPNRCY